MKRGAIAIAALLTAAALRAHDFWIEPSTFHPEKGNTVSVGLRVGQDFIGDPVPRMGQSIERYVVRQGSREEEVEGIEGADPSGFFRADGGRTAVIAYASRPAYVELAPAKFEAYLRQYGLERIIELRTRRGERLKPGREIFSRCAKALLTGRKSTIMVTQPLGLRYEIVPAADPTGGGLAFSGRIVYERRPWPGALVTAVFRDDPAVRLAARSDAGGRFSFALPRAGVWLIKSVQMIDAPAGSRAEWESLWGSLTFETR